MSLILAENNIALDITAPLVLSISGKAQTHFNRFFGYRGNPNVTVTKGAFQFDLYKNEEGFLVVDYSDDEVSWHKFANIVDVLDGYSFLAYEKDFLQLLAKETGFQHPRIVTVSTAKKVDLNKLQLVFKTELSAYETPRYVFADETATPREHHEWSREPNDWILTFHLNNGKQATVDGHSFQMKVPEFDLDKARRKAFSLHIGHYFAVHYGIKPKDKPHFTEVFANVNDDLMKVDGVLPTHRFAYRNKKEKREGFINVWGNLLVEPFETKTHTYMLFESLASDTLAFVLLNKNDDGSINYGFYHILKNLNGEVSGFVGEYLTNVNKMLSDYLMSKGFEADARLYGLPNLKDLKPENYTKIEGLGNVYILGKQHSSFTNRNCSFVLFENVNKLQSEAFKDFDYQAVLVYDKSKEVVPFYGNHSLVLSNVASKKMSAERVAEFNAMQNTLIDLGIIKVVKF